MALSPADFAAYSRATGTPYPEDPEERAQLAPEVVEFRRNQLRAPEQESALPGILGAAAVGLGALTGGMALSRALRGNKGQAAASTAYNIPRKAEQDLRTVATPVRQRVAEDAIRQARTEHPTGVRVVDLSGQKTDLPLARTPGSFKEFSRDVSGVTAAEKLAQDPELLSLVQEQAAEELSEARSKQSKAQAEYRNLISSIADDIIAQERASVRGPVVDQTIGALESGEDQMTGRTMRSVQRNEDLDVSQVNEAARQTGSADVAASMTPDGVPVDQTDPWGQATVPKKTFEINQKSTLLLPAAVSSPREKAQQFLQSRYESLSDVFPGRYRRERVMGMDPAIAEAAELYASTGDPSVLSRFSASPATPVSVRPTVQMDINTENLPTRQFFKPTGYPEAVGDLLERDIELTNEISSLGAQQQSIVAKQKELGEQELMLRAAMERDPEGGGAYTKMFGKVKFEQQNLPNPTSLNVDLGDALEERAFVRNQMKSLEALGSTYRLGDFQEGVRPFYEYDTQGNIIPQSLELRAGRRSVELEPKTGGGRLVSEYDPEGQSGSSRGIYGIELTSRRSGPTTRPTQMTMDELIQEGLEQAQASPEGDVPIPPSISAVTEQETTPQKRSSVNMSEAVLRAARQQGNRNPRGGVLPDEITQLRRQMAQPYDLTPEFLPEGQRKVRGLGYERQVSLPGVTGYAARQRQSPADVAANQLEAYMSKLQRGRSTPLTSQAVIQPRLF